MAANLRPHPVPDWHREMAARLRAQQRAAERAETLLLSVLSAKQRRQYRNKEKVTVIGKSGAVYRLSYGALWRMTKDGRHADERWCVYPADPNGSYLSDLDIMLAQILHLRASDKMLRRRAKVTKVVPPWPM